MEGYQWGYNWGTYSQCLGFIENPDMQIYVPGREFTTDDCSIDAEYRDRADRLLLGML